MTLLVRQPSAEVRVGAFLALDTEHGRSILRGVARYCRQRQKVSVLKFSQTSGYDEEGLRRLNLDGLIAKVGSREDEKVLARLKLPVVNISGQLDRTRFPTIDSDDLRVGEMAMNHFFSRGHRRFAYCGNPEHHASVLRLEAFRRAARQLDGRPSVHVYFVPEGDQDAPYSEKVRDELMRWVDGLPKPVGIFTFTDRIALEIEEACMRAEIRVPDSVAILGVGDDLTRLEFAHVELSSVELNTERIGLLAAERLLQEIEDRPAGPLRQLVPPRKIAIRRSTDRYAVSDSVVSETLDLIRQHLGNAVYVGEMARTLGVSRRVLELRFRSVLGESVYSAVQRLKIEYSLELLSDPSLSIGEIAFSTGFADQKAFSRAFSRRTGETPTAYRKKRLLS